MFGFGKKGPFNATLEPANRTLEVKAGEKLLTAALEAGIDWPHDCRVGSCGTCRCVLREGRIKALTDFSYTLEFEDIKAGAILACQSLLRSDCVIEIALGTDAAAAHNQVEHHDGVIKETRALTHDILEVVVAVEDPCFAAAKPGQYSEFVINGIEAPRSYSFAHPPQLECTGVTRYFIRHVPGGEFTDWLFAADRRATPVTVSGPYGSFYRRPGSGRMICIAGGSGLAPIKAILEAAKAEGVTREILLLFGARGQADLYCLVEFEQMAAQWPAGFEFVPVLSDEPDHSDWQGARGLVTEHIAHALQRRGIAPGDEAYLCGPPPMVDAGVAALGHLGLDETAIFFDKFLDASTQPRTPART